MSSLDMILNEALADLGSTHRSTMNVNLTHWSLTSFGIGIKANINTQEQ